MFRVSDSNRTFPFAWNYPESSPAVPEITKEWGKVIKDFWLFDSRVKKCYKDTILKIILWVPA